MQDLSVPRIIYACTFVLGLVHGKVEVGRVCANECLRSHVSGDGDLLGSSR